MNMLAKFTPSRLRDPFLGHWPSFFDDRFFGKDYSAAVPAVNIHRNDKQSNIEVSAAGFRKEDFRIAIENDLLTISAEHKTEVEKEDKNYTRREFSTSSFSRSFRVNREEVDEDGISASYENGILKITVPKRSTTTKEIAREIRIN